MNTNEWMPRKRKNISEETSPEDNYPEFRKFPLYVLLICGLILLLSGIYMAITKQVAVGTFTNGRYGGSGTGRSSINGIAIAIIGAGFSVFPAVMLIKYAIKRQSL